MIWICCSVDQSLEVPTGNQGVVDTSQSRVMFSVVHGRTSSTAVSRTDTDSTGWLGNTGTWLAERAVVI